MNILMLIICQRNGRSRLEVIGNWHVLQYASELSVPEVWIIELDTFTKKECQRFAWESLFNMAFFSLHRKTALASLGKILKQAPAVISAMIQAGSSTRSIEKMICYLTNERRGSVRSQLVNDEKHWKGAVNAE